MVLRNHIAYRLLTDESLWWEVLETHHPVEFKLLYENKMEVKDLPPAMYSLYTMLDSKGNKPYLVSESVVENIDMIKVNKTGDHYDWTVFKHLPDQKVTFILPRNQVLRMRIVEDRMHFCSMTFELNPGQIEGHLGWVLYYLNRESGELCEHFESDDVRKLEDFVYRFLCFFYLTDNNEEIIPAGKVYGTRKTGKISNDFKFPITMVTSRWNTTTIRLEKFGVRGHFRLQPVGVGRSRKELIFISPFEKKGYKRSAGKLTQ